MSITLWMWLPIAVMYGLALVGLIVYGLHCYLMAGLFVLRQKHQRELANVEVEAYNIRRSSVDYPLVTIQLPIYNELDIVVRLLESVKGLDYPRDRFEVQVLDDSTDRTREIIDAAVADLLQAGVDVQVIRRTERVGYKAGALAQGMNSAMGEYVAIFDADFIIPPQFLKRTVALLDPHPMVACVQGRWGHVNPLENWLTRAQSIGIDGHFTAEQGARGYSSLCLNFNGTAGTWRASAIEAAGGWQGDTLTEDLDLSYRAQLAGYTLRYDFDLECKAEIPNNVHALKSQQRRWAKGSMETARKLLPTIWASKRLAFYQKAEATLHLTHYAVAIFMCAICFLTLPMLLWTPTPKVGWVVSLLWGTIVVSAMAPCVMYTSGGTVLRRGLFSLVHFPAMLVLGTGICLNNAKAVCEAFVGKSSEFVRTPKSGSTNEKSQVSVYVIRQGAALGLVELLLGGYCFYTLTVYLDSQKYLFGVFLAAYAIGFSAFGLMTLSPWRRS